MTRRYGSFIGVLCAGLVAGGLAGSGCGMVDETCAVDADCTTSGEECLATGVCGCTPVTTGTDSCTEADAQSVCHPDEKRCVLRCSDDTECLGEGESCDLVTETCRESGGEDLCADVTCETGEVCSAGVCVSVGEACETSDDCEGADVCSEAGFCDPGCDVEGSAIVCDALDEEVCNPTTGLCEEMCQGDVECFDGEGFCSEAGLCEERTEITACNPQGTAPTTREYVDPETNMCTATKGALDTCEAAGRRSSSRNEVAAGPTLYAGESIARTASAAHCTNAPEVQFFVDYYDPTGGVSTTADDVYGDLFQSALTNSNTSNVVYICGVNKSDGFCEGVTSDQYSGRILFTLCRPASATDEEIAVYLNDAAGNYGNTLCIEIEPAHL